MSSFRPYRPGLGIDSAMLEISAKENIFFDKNVIRVLKFLISKKINMIQDIIL